MHQSINKTGVNLQWLRKRLSITLDDLSGILNVNTELIEQWESGESEPGKEAFQQLCSFFELDKSVFLLLDLSQADLFTLKKEVVVQKKLVAYKRHEASANKKPRSNSYH